MENTITIPVSDNFHELRNHGDTSFPFAAYHMHGNAYDIPWHWHEEYEFSVVKKGYTPFYAGSDSFLLEEGDGVLLNPGTLHAQQTSKASDDFCKEDAVFHGRLIYGSKYTVFWQKYIRPVSSGLSLPYIHLHASIDWQKEIIDFISQITEYSRLQPYGYEFRIRDLLSNIFLLLCQNQKTLITDTHEEHFQDTQHIKKMITHIQENFQETITLKDLASCANICEREVQRAFRNIIHQSPIQYLIHYRIGKACQMLDTGEQSIIEICNSCGFSSPSYFSKTFKKIVGCQPTEYRKTR